MSNYKQTNIIESTVVESAPGSAIRVEKINLTSFGKGLLRANSSGIRDSSATTDAADDENRNAREKSPTRTPTI